MSDSATPIFSALGLSMSTNTCGTLARYSVPMFAISGRACAAAMKFCDCSARYAGLLPRRSCSIIVNPDPVPRPGIAGGPNAKTMASVILVAKL